MPKGSPCPWAPHPQGPSSLKASPPLLSLHEFLVCWRVFPLSWSDAITASVTAALWKFWDSKALALMGPGNAPLLWGQGGLRSPLTCPEWALLRHPLMSRGSHPATRWWVRPGSHAVSWVQLVLVMPLRTRGQMLPLLMAAGPLWHCLGGGAGVLVKG